MCNVADCGQAYALRSSVFRHQKEKHGLQGESSIAPDILAEVKFNCFPCLIIKSIIISVFTSFSILDSRPIGCIVVFDCDDILLGFG